MATSLDTLSLSQMLDLAIGMPNNGAVHFAAMRKLLQTVLEHLDVQYLTSQEPWPGQLSGPSLADVAAEVKEVKREMEDFKKHMSKSPRAATMKKAQEAPDESPRAATMKKAQEAPDEDMSLSLDLDEEVGIIKMTQNRMAQTVKELAASMKKLEEDLKKLREDAAKWKEESSNEISQQLEALLEETKRELQKMEEQQEMRKAMLEQLVAETTSKLAEIGEMMESVQEEQERIKAECSNCSFDINEHLGELLQRCEKLQEQVESLESRQMAMGKLNRMMRNWGQDTEKMQPKDATVVQMQRDYEKLSFISGTLQKDSEKKQKAIEMLFQSLEKLQTEKADQQDMMAAMDMKADKAALGRKVNSSQFEANMERLDERLQELQSQISGQEQQWNNTQQQLSLVEEEKLDRQELKTFSNQMEEMWKRSIEDLKNEMKKGDSGAGIKKQLPVPFTCLSCDRMLTVQVPGQYPKTLPYLQPLPPSKEPQHGPRRPVVRGGGSHVPQSSGDHQSSSFKLPPIQDCLRNKALLQGLVTLPNKPRVTQLLGSGGHVPRGRSDQLPVVIRSLHEPGPATSRDHPRHSPPTRHQGTRAPPATPAP
ncbi:glutamine-rich protein 2-like [Motacilla alba alba]|uniref:glutamine-rich protein 2-like n=1 Tax=Motacilla alba alba TaxID=1094192 RepID=UPI0018D501A1|nr:glutamine-rich protein 2-like [Motacilla alba alba]